MGEMRARPAFQLPRMVTVETPENVVLEFELAGIGSRAGAVLYDTVAIVFLYMIVVFTGAMVAAGLGYAGVGGGGAILQAMLVLAGFAVQWGYFLAFEALRAGQTPGKKRMGIRVVMETGHPVTPQAAAVRNLVRIVDFLPGFYFIGILFVLFQKQHKRLGDLVAGTIVVRDKAEDLTILEETVSEALPLATAGFALTKPQLTDDEFALVERYLERRRALPPALRLKMSRDLVRRLAERFPDREKSYDAFLLRVHESEGRLRESLRNPAEKHGNSAPGGRTGERFVRQQRGRWAAFQQKLAEIEPRKNLEIGGEDLLDLAAQYRAAAADLARARTYGVDSRVRQHLARLVSSGHNILYGTRGVRRIPLGEMLVRRVPAEVWRSRKYVLAACLLFVIPAVVGYLLITWAPDAAYNLLPAEIISRAEAGVELSRRGVGYAEMPSPFLPLVASQIIANNIQVAFGAFAFGISAGIGTTLVLVFNGLFFGSILGLFENYRILDWIVTFVVGHGVLELTAIFIAGGAGFLVARGLLTPGDATRGAALVEHGRRAILLVVSAVTMLALAGTIEGLLSASDAPGLFKFGASLLSLVLLVLYFLAGRRYARLDEAEA